MGGLCRGRGRLECAQDARLETVWCWSHHWGWSRHRDIAVAARWIPASANRKKSRVERSRSLPSSRERRSPPRLAHGARDRALAGAALREGSRRARARTRHRDCRRRARDRRPSARPGAPAPGRALPSLRRVERMRPGRTRKIVAAAHRISHKVSKAEQEQRHCKNRKVWRIFAMFGACLKSPAFSNRPTGRTLRLLSCHPNRSGFFRVLTIRLSSPLL
jgi:hypothetical protein